MRVAVGSTRALVPRCISGQHVAALGDQLSFQNEGLSRNYGLDLRDELIM